MGKPLCIFDFDGVLVDTAAFLREEFTAALKAMGYRFLKTPDEARDLFSQNIAESLVGCGVSPDHLCALWERVQASERRADVRLCRGVAAMLAELAPVAQLAVVSANGVELMRAILGRLGVLARFSSISGGDEEMAKVKRIADCARTAGATRDTALYVGDATGDIAEAREAGVTTVAATWGMHGAEELAGASPDCIVHDPAELVDLVKALAASAAGER